MRVLRRPLTLLMTVDAVGGVWRYALDACRALAARGVDAVLVGMGPPPTGAQRAEAAAAAVRLEWLDQDLDWMAAGPDGLRRAGEVLGSVVLRCRPDVVHLNSPALAPFVGTGARRIAAAHSCLATWWRAVKGGPLPADRRWHRDATATGLRAADAVLAPSHAFAAALEAEYGTLPGLRVIRNATAPIAAMPKVPAVLAAGRWWDEGKNLATLDEATAALPWPVQVAGPLAGPGCAAPRPRSAEWLGDLAHDQLRHRMARAPIFASLSLYEPFGLAVLEAATAEAALVLADIPTFRELWGASALFVDPLDPADVADVLNELIASQRLRARLGRRAAARARDYGLERQADELLAAYVDRPLHAVAV